jgi:hypothetical protein
MICGALGGSGSEAFDIGTPGVFVDAGAVDAGWYGGV